MARRKSPHDCTGEDVPTTRAPAGMRTCCRSCEYTGVVTRQRTGPANVPSRRLINAVSMTVPSSRRRRGPDAGYSVLDGFLAVAGPLRGAGSDFESAEPILLLLPRSD